MDKSSSSPPTNTNNTSLAFSLSNNNFPNPSHSSSSHLSLFHSFTPYPSSIIPPSLTLTGLSLSLSLSLSLQYLSFSLKKISTYSNFFFFISRKQQRRGSFTRGNRWRNHKPLHIHRQPQVRGLLRKLRCTNKNSRRNVCTHTASAVFHRQ
jgi:hypothetical protein